MVNANVFQHCQTIFALTGVQKLILGNLRNHDDDGNKNPTNLHIWQWKTVFLYALHVHFSSFEIKPMIWAIIIKFDQIRKNWWRISCAEILEVGKNFFTASSVKKMSRFEEDSPEEIKRIAWKFTKTVILLGLAGYELIITNSAYGLVGYIYQIISGASSKNNC